MTNIKLSNSCLEIFLLTFLADFFPLIYFVLLILGDTAYILVTLNNIKQRPYLMAMFFTHFRSHIFLIIPVWNLSVFLHPFKWVSHIVCSYRIFYSTADVYLTSKSKKRILISFKFCLYRTFSYKIGYKFTKYRIAFVLCPFYFADPKKYFVHLGEFPAIKKTGNVCKFLHCSVLFLKTVSWFIAIRHLVPYWLSQK